MKIMQNICGLGHVNK